MSGDVTTGTDLKHLPGIVPAPSNSARAYTDRRKARDDIPVSQRQRRELRGERINNVGVSSSVSPVAGNRYTRGGNKSETPPSGFTVEGGRRRQRGQTARVPLNQGKRVLRNRRNNDTGTVPAHSSSGKTSGRVSVASTSGMVDDLDDNERLLSPVADTGSLEDDEEFNAVDALLADGHVDNVIERYMREREEQVLKVNTAHDN
eukprot:Lankesteria_metandrocarpae@DN10737_c0_g1_i1.p1